MERPKGEIFLNAKNFRHLYMWLNGIYLVPIWRNGIYIYIPNGIYFPMDPITLSDDDWGV